MTAAVAVVGLGPVGATLTLLLARSGVETVVIEREPEVSPLSRAVALDDEALRVLQAAGLQPSGLTQRPVRVRSRHGRTLLDLPPRLSSNGHPALAFFHQPDVERELRARLRRQPNVTLLLDHELERFEDRGDRVELIVHDRTSATSRSLTVAWLLAADGARSTVRRQLGIRLRGITFARRWLVVDTRRPDLGPEAPFEFICDPRRPTVAAPLPGGRRRWEFMLLPGEEPAEMEQEHQVRRLLSGVTDAAAVEVLRATAYTFHARGAKHWRRGRVLLAGDAAHLSPPFAGQGVSAGLGDAHGLAWRIAMVTREAAHPRLLDSYEAERRRHVTKLVTLSSALGVLIQSRSPTTAAVRDVALRALWAVPPVRTWATRGGWKPPARYPHGFILAGGGSRAGAQIPQPLVHQESSEPRRLDDVLGPHFAVIAVGIDLTTALDGHARDIAARAGVQLVQIGRSPATGAPEGVTVLFDDDRVLQHWLADSRTPILLVRPDRHLYAATSAADATAAVRDLVAHISPG